MNYVVHVPWLVFVICLIGYTLCSRDLWFYYVRRRVRNINPSKPMSNLDAKVWKTCVEQAEDEKKLAAIKAWRRWRSRVRALGYVERKVQTRCSKRGYVWTAYDGVDYVKVV